MGFTQRDLEVLNEMFKVGGPISCSEITLRLKLSQSTVLTAIRNMAKEGYVEVVGHERVGTVNARTYIPAEKTHDAVLAHMINVCSQVKDIISMEDLAAALTALPPLEQ